MSRAALHRLRIAIERDEPPVGAEPREDEPAVPAAAERAVDVHAARLRTFRPSTASSSRTRVCVLRRSQRKSFELRRQSARAESAARSAIIWSQSSLFQSSNFLPWPTRTTAFSSCAYSRSAGEIEHAARAVHVDVDREADQAPLQFAHARVEVGQRLRASAGSSSQSGSG